MAKGRERSAKWYFRNENEVMKSLGLKPSKGSGSSWIEKEDGENDFILAQLKSTDKQSYSIKKLDIEKLEHHAMIANKVPVFIIQFLEDNSIYALTEIKSIPKLNEYMKTGEIESNDDLVILDDNYEETKPKKKKKIKSNANAREEFYKQKEKEWESRKWQK